MPHKNQENPLRIGFDLDGVLLYNPARIFRPLTVTLKQLLPKKKLNNSVNFYYPKSHPEKILWRLVHWSSLFIAQGVEKIDDLVKKKKIKAYIVTSRYDCLKTDFDQWIKKLNKDITFAAVYHNKNDLQPHIFKEEKIKQLKLDYFIEDNFDIVQHINKTTNARCIWITNLFDQSLDYKPKFLSLQKAMDYIENHV